MLKIVDKRNKKKETVSASFRKAGVMIDSSDIPLSELSENIPLSVLKNDWSCSGPYEH